MKIKNIMFSGFAAAIFAGVCASAQAASVNLASKKYVDTELALKQGILTPGDNINILDNVISATGLVTTEKLTEVQNVLQDAIDEKQAAGDYADKAELETLKTTVETLKSGSADKETIETLKTTVETISADYAKKSELTEVEQRLQGAIDAIVVPTIPTLVSAFENDAGYITNDALTDLVSKTQLQELQTALQTEIAKKQEAGDYAQADALEQVAGALAELDGDVYRKAVIDQKIADVVAGGTLNLDGYAKTVDLEALEALVGINTTDIATIKSAGYQTAEQVSGAITTATADLATKAEVNAKQAKLTAGDNITIDETTNVISATGFATQDALTNLQTTLEAAIEEKQAKGDYLTAGSLTELNNAVSALQSGKADVSTVTALQNAINGLGDTYATKEAMSAADTALQNAIDAINIPSLDGYVKSADLATVATTGSYNDLTDTPTIPSLNGLATSEELNTLRTTLEAAIAEKQAKGDYLTAESLTELNNAVSALQSGKADADAVTNLQNAINGLGETYATKADMSAADTALQNAIDAIDLTPYAKTADVEAGLALKENSANKVSSATAEEIDAMSSEDKAVKFPSIAVSQTIANAAVTKVNEVAGDLSSLQTQVTTNTADIAEIKGAGYLTAESELNGAKIKEGTVAKAALSQEVQDALNSGGGIKTVVTGTENGTIAVDGTDVSVKGLGNVAFANPSLPTYNGDYMLMVEYKDGEYIYTWTDITDYHPDTDYGGDYEL